MPFSSYGRLLFFIAQALRELSIEWLSKVLYDLTISMTITFTYIPVASLSSDTGKDQVMTKEGKSGTRCSFVSLTSGSVLSLPGGVAGEKADLSWPGSLYLTLCIPIQLLNTHLYENTGHMCSCQLISAFLHSFLFCTHLNVTLTSCQRGFLFVRICITWLSVLCKPGNGAVVAIHGFFPVDLYVLTELVGGGWYLSLGCGGWYTWPGDWVQSLLLSLSLFIYML